MTENSAIEWTHHTFNPWSGCQKVAGNPACAHCYAEVAYTNIARGVTWGSRERGGRRVVKAESGWREPLKWNRDAEAAGERRRVFCASLADVFEEWSHPLETHDGLTPKEPITMQSARERLFKLIDDTPWLDWLLLTKRPENVSRFWPDRQQRGNVWLGTSVADQKSADEWIPRLQFLDTYSPCLFVSMEPLIGPIEMHEDWSQFLEWVIVGGESGPKARPCDVAWIHGVTSDCHHFGIPCHVKQLGSAARVDGRPFETKHKKGGDMDEWPAKYREICVREYPKVRLFEAAQ